MKYIIFLLVICSSTTCVAQARRSSGKTTTKDDFIGTWTLVKFADIHLDYLPEKVPKKIIRFTEDSVFIQSRGQEHAGTWKLVGTQPEISITGTNQFNYKWRARNDNDIFFTYDNGKHFEYFKRSKGYTDMIVGQWASVKDTNSQAVFSGMTMNSYYKKQLITAYSYRMQGDTLRLIKKDDNKVFDFLILKLTDEEFISKSISKGNAVFMKKKKNKFE